MLYSVSGVERVRISKFCFVRLSSKTYKFQIYFKFSKIFVVKFSDCLEDNKDAGKGEKEK